MKELQLEKQILADLYKEKTWHLLDGNIVSNGFAIYKMEYITKIKQECFSPLNKDLYLSLLEKYEFEPVESIILIERSKGTNNFNVYKMKSENLTVYADAQSFKYFELPEFKIANDGKTPLVTVYERGRLAGLVMGIRGVEE